MTYYRDDFDLGSYICIEHEGEYLDGYITDVQELDNNSVMIFVDVNETTPRHMTIEFDSETGIIHDQDRIYLLEK